MSENLAYALAQVLHNFGAAVVVAAPFFALWPTPRLDHARIVGWVILVAWGVQIGSGSLFGAISLRYYGQLPELTAVALTALAVKVTAALAGFLLTALYLYRSRGGKREGTLTFRIVFVLGATALTAAAFLRWFA